MLNFFREGLHYLYFAFFKTLTFYNEMQQLSKKKMIIVFLKTYLMVYFVAILLLIASIGISEIGGYSFYSRESVQRLFLELALILFLGLIGSLPGGLFIGLIVGLIVSLIMGVTLGYHVGGGLVDGLFVGSLLGLVGGLVGIQGVFLIVFAFALLISMGPNEVGRGAAGVVSTILFIWLAGRQGEYPFRGRNIDFLGGILVGLLLGLLYYDNKSVFVEYFLAFISIYFIIYFRLFYAIPHIVQYWRSNHVNEPFVLFHYSPIYWDQMIRMPLPFLQDWLVNLIKCDRSQGLAEIFFVVRERPFQRKAAFNALVTIAGMDLQYIYSVNNLKTASDALVNFPTDDDKLPKGLQDARRYINTISELAQDYQNRQTHVGQLNVLAELHTKMTAFHSAMKLTAAPVGTTFEPLAAKWLKMIEDEQEKLHQQSTHNELPNPYIAGNPLEVRDQQLFVGRSDILLAIEQFILNAEQRPSLLLYGRRRTGKSSTLLNLPRSRFEPVYIDCQDAKWHESDQAFCYNLAHDLFNVLYQSDSVRGLRQPQIEQFDKNAFTQLDQFLNQAQKIAEQRGKRILLAFDEYEELENSIINGDISEKVLGKLRNLIQHSKSIVVLVSGSHRFEELTRLNWANYLINTRTLELSYLDAESARELLTKPVPELHYEAGMVDDIIRITHCQPYLLQAVASELVNYLNSKQQTTATPDDLNTALEKTLVSASAYFSDTWRKDNSETEQQVMRALATGKTESVLADAALRPAIQSLIRKEIVGGTEGSYRLAVELFARWIVKNQV